MSEPTTIKFEGSFPVTHLKDGLHTFLIPLDDESAKIIGKIVVYWGAFEVRMDLLISTISEGLGKPPPKGWKRQSFRKRKELFRDLMREYTGKLFPNLTQTFDRICGDAASVHWRRNLIAHGYYDLEPNGKKDETGTHGVKYTAHGEVNGKPQKIEVSIETLSKIWHDIAHLNGALLASINLMGGKLSSVDLVIPDQDLLGDQGSGNFRLLAISERF